MEIIVGALVALFLIGGFVIINLLRKVEKLEKIGDSQNQYIINLSELIDRSDKVLRSSSLRDAFQADDQVGIFFKVLVDIQEQLNSYRV